MRNRFIDSVRGLAISIVVLGHAIQKCNGMSPSSPTQIVIMTFWMPLFFLISGYLCGMSSNNDYVDAAKRKVVRLLLPYIAWQQIHYLLSAIRYGNYSISDQFWGVLESNFWFLRLLFCAYLVWYSYMYMMHMNVDKWSCRLRIFLAFVSACCVFLLFTLVLKQNSLFSYFPCFIAGVAWFKIEQLIGARMARFLYGVAALIFCAAVPVLLSIRETGGIKLFLLDKSMALCGSAMVVVAAHLLSKFAKVESCLEWLGTHSLSIYSIHWCLFFSVGVVDWRNPIYAWICWMVCCVVMIVCWEKSRYAIYSVIKECRNATIGRGDDV